MKYFDTHCHLNGKFYKGNLEKDIESAKKEGVSHILLPGTTLKDSLFAIALAKKYQHLYAAVGIHPSHVDEEDLDYLKSIDPNTIVAVGEVGIDLYREGHPSLANQENVFKAHIEFALKHKKPLIVHMRNSEKEVYEILKKYPKLKFVLHSYTGSLAWAQKFLKLNAYFSFSGIVTFKNAQKVQEVAKIIPVDKILAETDAPFLAPVPNRGKENQPAFVKHTVDFLTKLRNQPDLPKYLFNNALTFFDL